MNTGTTYRSDFIFLTVSASFLLVYFLILVFPKSEPHPDFVEETYRVSVVVKRYLKDDVRGNLLLLGEGTGFIVRSDGLVSTVRHNVKADDEELDIPALQRRYHYEVISQGRKYSAAIEYLATEKRKDIAILRIAPAFPGPAPKLRVAILGDSDDVRRSDFVFAIGVPLTEMSVTFGYISQEKQRIGKNTFEYIQTDAAINPGNSGGPLTDMKTGKIIAMCSAKYVGRAYEGLGFCIPINYVKEILSSLVKKKPGLPRESLAISWW